MLTPEVRKNHGPRSSCGKTLNQEPNFWHWSILLTHKERKVRRKYLLMDVVFLEVAWDFKLNFAIIWRPSEFLFCIPYILWKKWICLRQVGNKSLEQFCNHLDLFLQHILVLHHNQVLDTKQDMVRHHCRIQVGRIYCLDPLQDSHWGVVLPNKVSIHRCTYEDIFDMVCSHCRHCQLWLAHIVLVEGSCLNQFALRI